MARVMPPSVIFFLGLYSLGQLVGAPIWGSLSDRIGRRPVLLITLLANVGASAMLTSTLPQVEALVKAVRAADPTAKILVGGAPVTQANADHYGADAFAKDAAAATRIAEELATSVRAARA